MVMVMKIQLANKVQSFLPVLGLTLVLASPAFAGDKSVDVGRGNQIYHETCVACHGADGKGAIPGAPNLTKSGGVLSLSEDVLEQRVENGFHSSGSPMAMPPKGGNPDLTKDDIRDVLAYMRATFQSH